MDEFQMIADSARGAHYEGAIILAPKSTQLLLLSGSVENPEEVAVWMRRLGRQVEVVATNDRPVPLEETPIEGLSQRSKGIEAWWPRMVTAVLMADLAPLLIFAPRRRDAESIARKLATNLPQGEPLSADPRTTRALAGKEFTTLLERRIAYHHSGLSYALRAGLVEPLAKGGQLRVIVSTMGLAAGINFSVRSVHVASITFHDGLTEQTLSADDLLQMFGRAGRRGLDERGYVITSRESPTLADARAAKLRRSSRLSWPIFLRVMRHAALTGGNAFTAAQDFAKKLFAKAPPELGLEEAQKIALGGEAAATLFGLKATRRELLNTEGMWEETRTADLKRVPLRDAWLARENYHGLALASTKFVQSDWRQGLGRGQRSSRTRRRAALNSTEKRSHSARLLSRSYQALSSPPMRCGNCFASPRMWRRFRPRRSKRSRCRAWKNSLRARNCWGSPLRKNFSGPSLISRAAKSNAPRIRTGGGF